MRWKNSLAFPIVALLLVFAVGMLLVGYLINDKVFYTALEAREKDKANTIRFATRSIIDSEVRKLSTLSGILKTDTGLTAALAHYHGTRGDVGPLKSAMDALFWRIDTQVFIVTDTDGVVLYRGNDPPKRGDRHLVWGFEEAVTGSGIVAASEGTNGWAIHALAPLRTGNRVAGILILGTRIDEAFAEKISRETGARISFANMKGVLSGAGGKGGTPPDPDLVRLSLLEQFPIFRMDLPGYRAMQYTPVNIVDETFCLVIETDLGIVRGMLHRNRVKLAETGALILACVLVLGVAATALLVRPLKRLQREAQGVVREFTGHELPLDGGGNEIHSLATAIRRMVEEIKTHISERGIAEQALKRSEELLRQSHKMEAIGRLAGGVAHDFNNLLTVINGYSEVLLRRLGDADPARREIGEIHKAGEKATTLTRQLLAFSRRQVLKPQAIRLNDVVTNLGTLLRRIIGEDIDLSTTLAAGLWTVRADPNQVEQVVLNLAVNARDAMPSGGKLSISTSNVFFDAPDDRDGVTVPAGRYVVLEIADTGCGMDSGTIEHIFEPFFSTKEHGKGTGLGLAMVHGIVMQTGGRIRVRSAPGKGTAFHIFLPMVDGEDAEPAEAPAVETDPAGNPRWTGNVLLAEDDETVRELVRAGLERDGYSILSARNGQEAIRIAAEHKGPIDLLLTDLLMPGMNGLELAERLTTLRPEMKVLYMSGYSEEAIPRFAATGVSMPFLQKPVTPSILSRKVREVLDSPS